MMNTPSTCQRCKKEFMFYDGYYDSLYHKGNFLCLPCFEIVCKAEKIVNQSCAIIDPALVTVVGPEEGNRNET
jgi:hypothetical protein